MRAAHSMEEAIDSRLWPELRLLDERASRAVGRDAARADARRSLWRWRRYASFAAAAEWLWRHSCFFRLRAGVILRRRRAAVAARVQHREQASGALLAFCRWSRNARALALQNRFFDHLNQGAQMLERALIHRRLAHVLRTLERHTHQQHLRGAQLSATTLKWQERESRHLHSYPHLRPLRSSSAAVVQPLVLACLRRWSIQAVFWRQLEGCTRTVELRACNRCLLAWRQWLASRALELLSLERAAWLSRTLLCRDRITLASPMLRRIPSPQLARRALSCWRRQLEEEMGLARPYVRQRKGSSESVLCEVLKVSARIHCIYHFMSQTARAQQSRANTLQPMANKAPLHHKMTTPTTLPRNSA